VLKLLLPADSADAADKYGLGLPTFKRLATLVHKYNSTEKKGLRYFLI
jgi:hypothetical protein